MFVCLFGLSAGYTRLDRSIDRASFDTRVAQGKKGNLSAEVPIEKLTPSHQRFFLYERKRTQLSYLSTIFFLSDVASNGIPNDMYLIIYL